MSDPYADFASPSPAGGAALSPVDPYSDFASHAPAAPAGTPGQDGLVWGADGGRDPKTGELVVAGKPMTQNAPSQGLAAMSGALSGIPIVGPYLQRGAVDAGAQVRQAATGDPADQTASAVQGDVARSTAAYPKTATAAGIGGALAATAPLVAAAPAMFGAEGGALTAGQLARGAASGAIMGGTDAGVRGNSIAGGAALGALGGAAAPAVGAGIGRALSGDGQLAAPTADALRAAADAGYDQARGMGVVYHAAPVAQVANQVRQNLMSAGILDVHAPQTYSLLSRFDNPAPGAYMPFENLDGARKAFGKTISSNFNNPVEQQASRQAQDALDGFVVAADPSTVISGPADAVGGVVGDARANYAASKRTDQLSGIGDAADLRAAAANSGQNIGNATRGRIASLLNNGGKNLAGFSDDEKAALESLVRGNLYQNVTRKASNYLGGGGGLGGMLTAAAGAHLGGPVGAGMAAVVGPGLKKLSNSSTVSALDQIIADTARRSPLYQQMMAAAPPSSASTYAPTVASTVPILAQLLGQQPDVRTGP